ncbi:type II toxin-antitoxin system prevent-host-death family antitoxin [bacterium CPR1]|nr:type II toxin-antitoxin system prevent-host-death family antitoxin [bacterium CPR1]
MVVVNVSEAKARLTELLQRAESGERVLIARRNEPIVELRLIASRPSVEPRPFGLCAGELQVPDDFDEPLPEDILRAFEG